MYGPSSLLYGANAFAGIVNVILKREKEVDGLSVWGMAGSWKTRMAELNFGKEVGRWRFMANGRLFVSDEMDFNGKYWVDSAGRHRTYNQDLSRLVRGTKGRTGEPGNRQEGGARRAGGLSCCEISAIVYVLTVSRKLAPDGVSGLRGARLRGRGIAPAFDQRHNACPFGNPA